MHYVYIINTVILVGLPPFYEMTFHVLGSVLRRWEYETPLIKNMCVYF